MESSMDSIVEKDGFYYLKGVLTPGKNEVFSSNRKLIERIAETSNGKFKANIFGLFSMYCSFRDIFSQPNFDRTGVIKEMLENDKFGSIRNGVGYGEDIYEPVFEMTPIADLLVTLSNEKGIPHNLMRGGDLNTLLPYVKKEFDPVSSEKMTALFSLHAQFGPPVPFLLLYLNGKYPFENFSYNPYQPDSKEGMWIFRTFMIIEEWMKLTEDTRGL